MEFGVHTSVASYWTDALVWEEVWCEQDNAVHWSNLGDSSDSLKFTWANSETY